MGASDYEGSVPFGSGSESETEIEQGNKPPIIHAAIDVEQIALVYPSIKIDEKERGENIEFRKRMAEKKLELAKKKKESESNKFIKKMLNAIKNKTMQFKTRKNKQNKEAAPAGEE